VSIVFVWEAGSELAQPTSAKRLMQTKNSNDFMLTNIKFFAKKTRPQWDRSQIRLSAWRQN